ncbi:crooked neck-like protein 1 [Silurus meridionalis]|uniref:Uncharacterized protein n=1 Tax=Silurus meridionalis TaxID=175797 RepID=A0A8T0AG07_SILME|nr:crooked neck-like protein 1 [Silurus meridionalis]KAF7690445.1 hypothetical protein HF521_012249 [Silurus meridionalis]
MLLLLVLNSYLVEVLNFSALVTVHPEVKNWTKYARFEDKHGFIVNARKVYERATEFFGEEQIDVNLYLAFAKFEEKQKEYDRVRVIYKYALDRIPKQQAHQLINNYIVFERNFGDRRGIEDVIISKRRFHYEEEVKANPHNKGSWFDYLRLYGATPMWTRFEMCTNEPSPTFPPILKENTGGATFTCGSITLSTRS